MNETTNEHSNKFLVILQIAECHDNAMCRIPNVKATLGNEEILEEIP